MNRVRSILGVAAVIVIAVVLILGFRPATGQSVDSAPVCAVEVKGSCISSTEFTAAYRLLASSVADASALKAMNLRRLTMEGLLDRWVLVEDAKRLGVTVSDTDLSAELTQGRAHVSLPSDKIRDLSRALQMPEEGLRLLDVKDRKTKKFDEKTYIRQVRYITQMHPEGFREFQRLELIAARMRELIGARVHVGETEAFEQFAREKSTRTLAYARFDRRFYGDVVVDRSREAIGAWTESHKDELEKVWESRKSKFTPECRTLRRILAKISPTAETPEAGKAEAKKRIDAALARLRAGEDFGDVAADVSDDASAVRGGDLGCVAKGDMVKPLEDVAFALEVGALSDAVGTEDGFHVIRLERVAKDAEAEKIGKEQVQLELYLAQESERLTAEAAKQVSDVVRGGKTLEEALKTHLAELSDRLSSKTDGGGDKRSGGEPKRREPVTADNHRNRPVLEATLPFNRSGDPIPDVRYGSDVPTIAFTLEKPGDVAPDILPLSTGYAVLQLKDQAPASKEQWEKDRDFYMSAMRAAKQNDALNGYVKRLRASLGGEIKLNQALMADAKADTKNDGEPLDGLPDDN